MKVFLSLGEKYARRSGGAAGYDSAALSSSRRKRSPRPCVPRRRLSWRVSLQTSPAIALRAAALYQTGQTRAAYPRFWRMMGWPINIWRRETLTAAELRFAQDSLRLFSAFYGPLRPLDAIRPLPV